ncbi:unnamed protein product [Mytilus coruscus]|uniref:Uncharacterized protein n=1 Tax=Mytilus coruscus TaxID=42192 RepID=A0A6J8EZF4_MYTCO|nr:unnamed protein product [Mytilus coruscus]
MSSSKITVVVDPVKNPRGIPHFETKNFKSKKIDSVSEYQAVYRKWPFQKPRTTIRPKSNKYDVAAPMKSDTTYRMDFAQPKLTGREKKQEKKLKENEQYKYLQDEVTRRENAYRKTTYDSEFCPKEVKRRKPFTAIGEQSYRPPNYKFSCQSMYQLSYLTYSPDVIKKCRPNMITPQSKLHSNVDRLLSETCPNHEEKSKDNPEEKPSHSNSKSSNPQPEEDVAINQKTQENDSSQVPEQKKGDLVMISTFMADYKPNWNVKKRTLCKPEETNYREDVTKFDGTTTQNSVYKEWPVSKPEVPLWAKKPVYKQPMEGMALNSTYSMDFADPKVIKAVASMKPPPRNEDIIKSSGDGSMFKPSSTYNNTFKEWNGAKPAKTFLVKSVYNPPKDKMDFESTHRKCYTGQLAQKAEIIRHSSEHRQLNKDGKLCFQTTYRETYKDHRPKSCPGSGGGKMPAGVKTAWHEDLSSKKELNESHDKDIIKSSGDGSMFKPSSTYNNSFKEWNGAQPAKTFLVKSVYNPPKDKMDFESTHRKYYTGQLAQKAEIIRHTSEHRQLNKDGKLCFQTTYNATYKDHRPKSCPGSGRGKMPVGVKTAWQEDLSSKKELNESHDSGIDMIECDNKREEEDK